MPNLVQERFVDWLDRLSHKLSHDSGQIKVPMGGLAAPVLQRFVDLEAADVALDARLDPLEAAWITYAPTLTNITLGNGVLVGKYARIGRTIHFRIVLVWGTGTSSSGQWVFTLPTAPNTEYPQFAPIGYVIGEDAGAAIYNGPLVFVSPGSAQPTRSGGSGGTIAAFSNVAPFTWGNGDKATLVGTYEAAA